MVLLTLLARLTADPEARKTFHEATNESPLHVLPAPVLVVLALACLLLAACVAGLTLGLMSLDPLSLEIVMQSNNPREAAAARAVKPVREQGNLLLVTLLFANTLATELLPLVLEALVPGGYFSLVVSVVSIMLFGEIIPQAICSRHPLLIGSYMIGFVKVLRALLFPLSYPIAYLLDVMLGKELGTIYNREELKGLIDVHASNAVLTQDETTILKGALEFSQKTVSQILTPAENVFSLDIDSLLDRETLLKILRSGHSRVPLYETSPNNIICLLLVKQLVLVNPDDGLPIRSLISKKKRNHKIRVAPALECAASTLIADLLNEFQTGRSHMAIVYDDITKDTAARQFIGIVSIEDIIEEILQEEIIDETDEFTDNTNNTQVLVRNADGQLVRATAQTSHAFHVPGTQTAVVVKEINVPALREPLGESGEKMRPDWKKSKSKKKQKSSTNSPAQSLLSSSQYNDVEAGMLLAEMADTSSDARLAQQMTSQPHLRKQAEKNYTGMQYATLPGQSSTSLFGEDDNVIPEDLAFSGADATGSAGDSWNTVADALKSSAAGPAGRQASSDSKFEPKQTLKVRPLPDDASDEREVKIPQRQRTFDSRKHRSLSAVPGSTMYGSITDVDDIGGSGDEAPDPHSSGQTT